jgi:FAD-linked sulfhydryl oxidase
MTVTVSTSEKDVAKKPPCRVCSQFKTVTKGIKKKQQEQKNPGNSPETAVAVTATSTAETKSASSSSSSSPASAFPCPPDSAELGRSTWTFLHTMAAYYPDSPTLAERAGMRSFLNHFAKFYPCGYCAGHLREYSMKHPPNVDNSWELSQWMCQVHNDVNERQGKETFDCRKVFERWKDGSPGSEC